MLPTHKVFDFWGLKACCVRWSFQESWFPLKAWKCTSSLSFAQIILAELGSIPGKSQWFMILKIILRKHIFYVVSEIFFPYSKNQDLKFQSNSRPSRAALQYLWNFWSFCRRGNLTDRVKSNVNTKCCFRLSDKNGKIHIWGRRKNRRMSIWAGDTFHNKIGNSYWKFEEEKTSMNWNRFLSDNTESNVNIYRSHPSAIVRQYAWMFYLLILLRI